MANDAGSEEPRRWAPSRIASAAVLVILVLGGVAYGIYSLTSSGGSGSNSPFSTKNNQHLTSPKPKSSNNAPIANNNSSSSNKSTSGSTKSTNDTSTSGGSTPSSGGSSTTSGQQLSNTGPGDTAIIGFAAAAVLGTVAHYGWRKLRSES